MRGTLGLCKGSIGEGEGATCCAVVCVASSRYPGNPDAILQAHILLTSALVSSTAPHPRCRLEGRWQEAYLAQLAEQSAAEARLCAAHAACRQCDSGTVAQPVLCENVSRGPGLALGGYERLGPRAWGPQPLWMLGPRVLL